MHPAMEVDHKAIWDQVGQLQKEVGDVRDEIRNLNGKIDKQFERFAGKFETLSAVLTERQKIQDEVVKNINILFDRQRQMEAVVSSHQSFDARLAVIEETRLAAVEEKQASHGEKLAQVAVIGAIAGAVFAAVASSAASKIMSPSKGHIEPVPHARLAPLV